MKIAITGASGFLGKKLVGKFLKSPDVSIVAFTSQVNELTNFFNNSSLKVYDRNDFYGNQLEGVDVLINCAFPRNIDGTEMAKGLNYISNVYRIASCKNVGAVINISSQSVYSQKRETAADEKYPLCLESTYAVGKYASELLTNIMFRYVQHTNIRLASLIGVELNQRVINKMIDNAIKSKSLSVSNDRMKFGFMDVDDAVDAIISIVNHGNLDWEEVYNLGIDGSYTLVEMANVIKEELKKYSMDINISVADGTNELNSSLDCSKFNKKYEFSCKHTISDTVKKIIDSKLA